MTVTGNVLYWTSTFIVKKEKFPGMLSFTLLVGMPTWPGHGPYKDGIFSPIFDSGDDDFW